VSHLDKFGRSLPHSSSDIRLIGLRKWIIPRKFPLRRTSIPHHILAGRSHDVAQTRKITSPILSLKFPQESPVSRRYPANRGHPVNHEPPSKPGLNTQASPDLLFSRLSVAVSATTEPAQTSNDAGAVAIVEWWEHRSPTDILLGPVSDPVRKLKHQSYLAGTPSQPTTDPNLLNVRVTESAIHIANSIYWSLTSHRAHPGRWPSYPQSDHFFTVRNRAEECSGRLPIPPPLRRHLRYMRIHISWLWQDRGEHRTDR